MKFKDILDAALDGKAVRRNKNDDWMYLGANGVWFTGDVAILDPISIVEMKLDTWEIRQDEICVYGLCDSDGLSVLSSTKDEPTFIFGENRRPCLN